MANRRIWTCDFKDCNEIAQWYRRYKRDLFKFCTKHETQFARQHWGRSVDFSDLDEEDIRYLQEKESHSEYVKRVPFKIQGKLEERIHFIEVNDRKTGEWRSFKISEDNWNWEGFHKISSDLENGKFSAKPSVDEFVDILKKAVSLKTEK